VSDEDEILRDDTRKFRPVEVAPEWSRNPFHDKQPYDLGDVVASLNNILEAVRALKPAESGHTMPAAAELRSLLVSAQVEVERLQAKVADQALTIGTLRDIIGKQTAHFEKLRAENAELKAENEQLEARNEVLLAENTDTEVALKRFREREHKVDALLFGADGCATVLEKNREVRSAQQLRADIAAVRDFKGST